MPHNSWYWQRLWDVLTGDFQTQPPQEIPLLASLCFYSLTLLLGRLFRSTAHQYAPAPVRPYLCDLITSFQLLACSLENGQLRKHYGNGAYLCVLFVVGLYFMVTINDGSSSNPGTHVISYLHGKERRILRVVLRILVQLLGALLSYRYARLFWSLGLTESHSTRYTQLYCLTDLNVPLSIGLCMEYIGSLLDHLLWRNTLSKFHNTEMFFKCLFGSYMTLFAVDYTGWYLNPLNATNQTFGCYGSSVLEHLLVYWVGPLSGVATAVYVQYKIEGWKSQVYHSETSPLYTNHHAGLTSYTDHGLTSYTDHRLSLDHQPEVSTEYQPLSKNSKAFQRKTLSTNKHTKS